MQGLLVLNPKLQIMGARRGIEPVSIEDTAERLSRVVIDGFRAR